MVGGMVRSEVRLRPRLRSSSDVDLWRRRESGWLSRELPARRQDARLVLLSSSMLLLGLWLASDRGWWLRASREGSGYGRQANNRSSHQHQNTSRKGWLNRNNNKKFLLTLHITAL